MRYGVVILLVLLVVSCAEVVVEEPENLIPEQVLSEIYFDVSLINASKNSGYDKFREQGINTWEYIYEKYDIDSAQLAESGNYYASIPLVHERIFERVANKLDSLKTEFDEELNQEQRKHTPEEKRPDSLQNVIKGVSPDSN